VEVGAAALRTSSTGGVHFDLGEFSKDVRFRPTVELGVGDHVTLLTGAAEVHYVFSKGPGLAPIRRGGAGFTHAAFDDHARRLAPRTTPRSP